MREVIVTGTFRYTNTWPIAIRFFNEGKIQLDPLVTDKYGIEEVADALTATPKPSTLKRIVYPAKTRLN
jgi:L-iditol 2-dehydrogenase